MDDDDEQASSILNFLENGSFKLPPLQDASRQIRLLKILPILGTKDEICCSMRVCQLDDPGLRYTAISYTWGEPKPKKYIYVDKRPLQVSPNCWYALWQVKNNVRPASSIQQEQQHKHKHVYWIDAICINQEDTEEKSIQVAAMGRIYAQAVSVAACIGYESHDSLLFDENFAWRWRNLARSEIEHQKDMLTELIEHLLQRPWFHRLWTVQECILAKDIHVFCGARCVRWRMLRGQLQLTRNSYSRPEQYNHLDNFFRDIDTSQMPRGRIAFNISTMIRQYSIRECAVPHDKVYGLLSVVGEHTQKRLTINYEMPLFDLLWSYAEAISNHRLVAGQAQLRPDTPKYTWSQYSSISNLAETFLTSASFIQDMNEFWKWRLSGMSTEIAGKDARTYIGWSSEVFCANVTKVHCHRIGTHNDKVEEAGVPPWSRDDEKWKTPPGYESTWLGKSGRLAAPVTKVSTSHAQDVIEYNTRVNPKLIKIGCSDNPEWPGEMHFLLPSGAQDNDFLIPMEYPENRGYFYLVCRPTKSPELPLKAEIVGLSIRVRQPRDSRAYMLWLRDQHTAEIYLRPYDLMAIALLEDSGLQYVDLPRMEEESMASHVLLRNITKEERGY